MADTKRKNTMKFKEVIIGVLLITFMSYGYLVTINYISTGEVSYNIFNYKSVYKYLLIMTIGILVYVVREFKKEKVRD